MNQVNIWRRSFLICLCLLLLVASYASGQNEKEFKDPEGKYELSLPNNWQAVSYQDAAGKNRFDIIYRDRAYGLLKITQEKIAENSEVKSMINQEIDQNLRFRPGYVYNNIERFIGQYARGEMFEFDFIQAGQKKKARYYYLKTDNATVWVLRFNGNRDVLSTLRNETDAIARSFKPMTAS